jgi:hypothetical protein
VKVKNWVNSCVSKCTPAPKNYVLDRSKMDDHFSLIMGAPDKIKTTEELRIANAELILFRGWMIVDFLTVLLHSITTVVLITPLFGFTLLERVMYAPFSLIPD